MSSNWKNITADNDRTFTDCMEQLQEGYVNAVAATAGCSVEIARRDKHGFDLLILRDPRIGGEEASMWVQLKNTTKAFDASKPTFSYQFSKRDSFDRLARFRSSPKAILIVMKTSPIQTAWTVGDHDYLRVHHCCYWASLEGRSATAGVESPSVRLSTANVFDAPALTRLMDKLELGEPL